MANTRNGIPAGWTWRADRGGAPQWVPSPTLRKAGWTAFPLKTTAGAWLDKGASIEKAEAVNAAVAAWRAGSAVPSWCAPFAPAGAADEGGAAAQPDDRLSIGRLIDAYLASNEMAAKAASTRRDYKGKLSRLVDTLGGFAKLPEPPARSSSARSSGAIAQQEEAAMAAYKAAIAARTAARAKVRGMSVFLLQPVETPKGIVNHLYDAYHKLKAHAGVNQAFGVMACASAWLHWCQRHQASAIRMEWAADIERATPPGRIVTYTWPEIKHLVDHFDGARLEWVSDTIIFCLDLSWSEVDVLKLSLAMPGDRADTGQDGRQKTGRVGGTPLGALGRARLNAIRLRYADAKVTPTKLIHITRERNRPRADPLAADVSYLTKVFAEGRAIAALTMASLAAKRLQDLRDTAFSWAREAGMDDDQTASRTLQSRTSIKALGDKAYGEIGPAIADAAVAKLDALYEKIGAQL